MIYGGRTDHEGKVSGNVRVFRLREKSVQGHTTFTFGNSVGSRKYRMNPWTEIVRIPLNVETGTDFFIKRTENKKNGFYARSGSTVSKEKESV